MLWYLLACSYMPTSAGGGHICLPLQPMADQKQCEFVAQHYRSIAGGTTRCLALRKKTP